MSKSEVVLQDFQEYFPYAPTALSIRECVRLDALRRYSCPSPILDVGCGDGLFAKIAFSGAEVWGIDIDGDEARHAQASRAYVQVILADIARAGVPEGFFASCVANCSLEHVPQIREALVTIRRSLKPGAEAFFFLPNRDWARHLLSVRLLHLLGAKPAARAIEDGINTVFRHYHLRDEAGWKELMEQAGFEVVSIEPVGSTAATVAFELFLVPSIAGWINKHLTSRWTNFPKLRSLAARPAFGLVRAALALNPDPSPTAEFLVICRKPG